MSESADGLARAIEGIDDSVEAIGEDAAALRAVAVRTGWFRVEYLFFLILLAFLAAYFILYLVLGVDLDRLKDWGYLGIFFIALAGSATIVLPTPSNFAIFGSSAVLDPVFGIPAPLMVGLIAGLGDALGEFSGYALGYAGTDLIKHRRLYATFERWMKRRGMLTIFLLSTFPNPAFDLVGAAAGASRLPSKQFFLAALGGKIVKDLFLAYGGSFSIGLLSDTF
jgi:membrane protein YqaA with SNARE-associated domain